MPLSKVVFFLHHKITMTLFFSLIRLVTVLASLYSPLALAQDSLSSSELSCRSLLSTNIAVAGDSFRYSQFETQVLRVVDQLEGRFGSSFIVQRQVSSGWGDSRKIFDQNDPNAGDISWDLREYKYTLGPEAADFWGFNNFDLNMLPLSAGETEASRVEFVSVPSVEYLNKATDFFNSSLAKSDEDIKIPLKYYWSEGAFSNSLVYLWHFAFEGKLPISDFHRQFYHDISGHSLQGLLSHNLLIDHLREQVRILFDLRQAWFEFLQTLEFLRSGDINLKALINSKEPLSSFLSGKGIVLSIYEFENIKLNRSSFFQKVAFADYVKDQDFDINSLVNMNLEDFNNEVEASENDFSEIMGKTIPLIDTWGNLYILFTDFNSMKTLSLVGKELDKETDEDFPNTGVRGLIGRSKESFMPLWDRLSSDAYYPRKRKLFPADLILESFPESLALKRAKDLEALWNDFNLVLTDFRNIAQMVSFGGPFTDLDTKDYQEFLRKLQSSEFFKPAFKRLELIRSQDSE